MEQVHRLSNDVQVFFSKAKAKSAMEAAEREARAKYTMQPMARAWSKAKCRPKALLRSKARAKAKSKVPTIIGAQIDSKEALAEARANEQAPTMMTTNIQLGRAQALAKARAQANSRVKREQALRVISAPARAQERAPEEAKPISKARRVIGASHWGHEGGERRKQHTFKVYVPTANSMPGSSSGS